MTSHCRCTVETAATATTYCSNRFRLSNSAALIPSRSVISMVSWAPPFCCSARGDITPKREQRSKSRRGWQL